MTTTLATLRQELSDEIDDKWASTVTTLLAADNYVIDTALAQFPDNSFIDQWVLITAQNNAAQKRRIKAFTSSTYKLETYGSAWTLDTVKAT